MLCYAPDEQGVFHIPRQVVTVPYSCLRYQNYANRVLSLFQSIVSFVGCADLLLSFEKIPFFKRAKKLK